jgi:hypothetical protein
LGLPFGDASAFVEMLKIVEAFIILGIIIVVIMLPLNLIKYRMPKRFVKEFLDYKYNLFNWPNYVIKYK